MVALGSLAGVLVVSINYRLGALGWMVSIADNLWGNYGLQVRVIHCWKEFGRLCILYVVPVLTFRLLGVCSYLYVAAVYMYIGLFVATVMQ